MLPQTDLALLCQAVVAAAHQELMPRFRHTSHQLKADGSVVTEADMAMQHHVSQLLQQFTPTIPLLGEEMAPAAQQQLLERHAASGLWILDPLDGTANYAAGIPIFAVSLALVQDGVAWGMIYDPNSRECFCATRSGGATLNGQPLTSQAPATIAESVAAVDLKRLSPQLASQLAMQHPFRSQRNFGSGALDWGWIASGRTPIYLHGGQKLWDYAAGSLILHEAGGYATTLAAEAVYNATLAPRSVVAAASPALHQQWLAQIHT
jgi:myo-inositol-1(or 4)-monophosphatase